MPPEQNEELVALRKEVQELKALKAAAPPSVKNPQKEVLPELPVGNASRMSSLTVNGGKSHENELKIEAFQQLLCENLIARAGDDGQAIYDAIIDAKRKSMSRIKAAHASERESVHANNFPSIAKLSSIEGEYLGHFPTTLGNMLLTAPRSSVGLNPSSTPLYLYSVTTGPRTTQLLRACALLSRVVSLLPNAVPS